MGVGIEAINFYGGRAYLDIRTLFGARQLDLRRFDNLMLHRKSVALPCEDPVTFGVNAARPMLERLGAEVRGRIELLVSATESGLDFGKSISTYLHDHLKLSRTCRLFEVKHACYGGTAALQTALNFVAANSSPGAKALVIATDQAKAAIKGSYVEPSQGAGAVALLVGDQPGVLEIDFGANGYHAYEVMDSCRPTAEIETGDSDLSLVSYLECLEQSFKVYAERVEGADFLDTFDYLAFHTPFPGMVKGAHRMMMRKLKSASPAVSDADFERRVAPSLRYCREIGNLYSATVYLALAGLLGAAPIDGPRRVGLYSYGSGCCAEFFSGVISPGSQRHFRAMPGAPALEDRHALSMEDYDALLELGLGWTFGTKDRGMDVEPFRPLYERVYAGRGLLTFRGVRQYHREYDWS